MEGALSCTLVWLYIHPKISFISLILVKNDMKLTHNADYHKTQIKFGGVTFTILQLCPFTNGKITEYFISVL